MATKLVATQHYTAGPDQVYALYNDPGFIEARLEADGGLNPEVVSMDVTDSGVDIVTRQAIPASALPSAVTSFISGDPSTQRTENWRPAANGYEADLKVTIHGAPATLRGTITLVADGGGSTVTVNADANVPIPLFGGKIEKVIVEQLTELFKLEEKFTEEQLAGE